MTTLAGSLIWQLRMPAEIDLEGHVAGLAHHFERICSQARDVPPPQTKLNFPKIAGLARQYTAERVAPSIPASRVLGYWNTCEQHGFHPQMCVRVESNWAKNLARNQIDFAPISYWRIIAELYFSVVTLWPALLSPFFLIAICLISHCF